MCKCVRHGSCSSWRAQCCSLCGEHGADLQIILFACVSVSDVAAAARGELSAAACVVNGADLQIILFACVSVSDVAAAARGELSAAACVVNMEQVHHTCGLCSKSDLAAAACLESIL